MKREHKTFFGRTIGVAWDSFKSLFEKAYEDADHVLLEAAIIVTNTVKDALKSGTAQFIVGLTPTKIDDNLLKIANENLPKLLASELFLKGINNASTQEEVQAALSKVLEEFGGLSDEGKQKFYTSLAADVYILFEQVKNGKKITFGQGAQLVETAYQDWLALKNAA